MLTDAQVIAQNNFGDTRTGGLAGPMGMFLIILLAIVTVLLIRNMNARLRRLPDRFPSPAGPDGLSVAAGPDGLAMTAGADKPGDPGADGTTRLGSTVVDPTVAPGPTGIPRDDSGGSVPMAPTSSGTPRSVHDSR